MSYVSPRVPSPSSRIPVPAASPRVQVPDSTASSGATVYAAPRPIPITPPTLTSIADAQDGVTLAVPSRPGVETDSAKLQRIKSWPQRALRDPVPRFPWLEGPPKKSSPLQSTSGPIGLEPEDTAASTRTRPADTLVENNQPTVHKAKPTSGARQRSRSDLLQSQRMPESSEEMTVDGINQRPQLFPLSHTRQASVPQKPTDLMPVSESEVPLKFDPMYSWLHEGPAVPFGAKHHGQRLGLIQRSGGEVEPIPITNTPSSEDEEISSTFPSTSISVSSHRATTSISASIGPSSHGSSPPPSSATLFDSLVPSPGPYGSFSSNTASSQAPCVDIMYANGGKPTEHWVQGRTAAEVHNWVTQACPILPVRSSDSNILSSLVPHTGSYD
ncbi:hypothetical protein CALCODRAFT_184988 [Calocera cornea HHB12733]|uniref:Uncharacterized protein n=1 Tax=Calocera cornea HHB12733 TaxID=1353952 RepID=A0A165C9Z5_9BASI|nr:hypothetical protein CALCODRAFT_184988 [Calocera cornea HHB12733]